MRMLCKVEMSTEASNRAMRDGQMPAILQKAIDDLKPESAFFYAEHGNRCAHFIFDLKHVADIPVIAEPFFTQLNAKVQFIPVMNYEDLKAGLSKQPKKP